ncbi:MAG: hypothetical protein K2N54_00610, partial [Helicobacter sp.]|nr:hypothetical protein [Helicobacter sp.]
SPFDPQSLARSSNVAPHGLCRTPQRGGNVTPFGSNIAAARCGWDAHTMSNSKFCHCEHS